MLDTIMLTIAIIAAYVSVGVFVLAGVEKRLCTSLAYSDCGLGFYLVIWPLVLLVFVVMETFYWLGRFTNWTRA